MIQPRGATALVDAIWSSIEDMEKCSPDGDSNSTRTIVVMTDGFDNSSKITKDVLNTKIVRLMALASIAVWVGTITTGRFLAYTNSVLLASRFF